MWRRCDTTRGKPKRVCPQICKWSRVPTFFSFTQLCVGAGSQTLLLRSQQVSSTMRRLPTPATLYCMSEMYDVWYSRNKFASLPSVTWQIFFFYFNLKVRTWHWSLSFLYHQGNHLQFGANRSHWNWLISQSGSCFVRATETELGLKLVSESSLLLSEMTM